MDSDASLPWYLWLRAFLGKGVGLALGGYLGGELGAVCGVILGHSLDDKAFRQLPWSELIRWPSVDKQSLYHQALFTLLGHLAKCDGRVSPQEIECTEGMIRELGLTTEQRQQAIEYFNQGKQQDLDLTPLLKRFTRRFRHAQSQRLGLLDRALTLTYAEGQAHPQQIARLQQILPLLNISYTEFARLHHHLRVRRGFEAPYHDNPSQNYQRKKRQQREEQAREEQTRQSQHHTYTYTAESKSVLLAKAYQVLDLQQNASEAHIKKTYRRLMSRHHPDKLIAQGIGEPALSRAKERVQQIHEAYALIRKERGF